LLIVVQEQAVAESKTGKVIVKDESPVEVEARLRAQMAAARENGADEVTMQVDAEVCKERIQCIFTQYRLKTAKPWLPVLQPWIDSVAKVLPPHVNEVMGCVCPFSHIINSNTVH
jgi:hypothetical protein